MPPTLRIDDNLDPVYLDDEPTLCLACAQGTARGHTCERFAHLGASREGERAPVPLDPAAVLLRAMAEQRELDDVVASPLVRALEAGWSSIRARHPEVPPVVIVLGSGVDRRNRHSKRGHFQGVSGWRVGDAGRPEVMLAGESLDRTAEEIFGTLIHEAAHALNHARGIQDTTRGGRYHNRKYVTAAEEVGLTVTEEAPNGHCRTALTEDTAADYAREIDGIRDALRIAKDAPPEQAATGGRKEVRGTLLTFVCACTTPRKLRMFPSTAAEAPVTCGACGADFCEVKS